MINGHNWEIYHFDYLVGTEITYSLANHREIQFMFLHYPDLEGCAADIYEILGSGQCEENSH